MKNLLFLFCFFLVGSMSLNAQAACAKKGKACCASKKSAMKADATDTKVASATMTANVEAAEALAETDENIEKRVNAANGEVTFYQKSQCETTGKVKWSEVKYCDKSNKFTQVASASMEKGVEEASETTTEKSAKKACCAGKKDGKACTKKEKTEE